MGSHPRMKEREREREREREKSIHSCMFENLFPNKEKEKKFA